MDQNELRYTATHEWVRLYRNHVARFGITEYGQHQLGNISFVDLPEIGSDHEQFDSCVIIEGEKMLSEIDLPLGGRILDANEELYDNPLMINHDPYGDGWIAEIEILSDNEIDTLMDYDEYQKFLEEDDVGK